MTNQSVINKGHNTLYYFASNIEGYEPDKTYLIRLEKKGCKVRVLRAKTKACGCRVEFLFVIKKCLEEKGLWSLQILKDEEQIEKRELYFQTTVEVY